MYDTCVYTKVKSTGLEKIFASGDESLNDGGSFVRAFNELLRRVNTEAVERTMIR